MSQVKGPVGPPLSAHELINRRLYENSLVKFTAAGWPCLEPSEFSRGWHVDAICEHLEAVANWQIKRGLLINIPPRHMKSLAANVFFPAWVWAQNPNPDNDPDYGFQVRKNSWRGPGVKFMHLSYDGELSSRDSVKCRRVLQSNWYQRLWGNRVEIQTDQNQKTRFDNTVGGQRIATSEGGTFTGEGGDIIIFDDPHNVKKVVGSSDTTRETTLLFWDEAMPTRLNDQKNGVFIVIMQRVHERDLSAHILAKELGWTHLCLPAAYEKNHPTPSKTSVIRKATGEPWNDPRQEGDPLWPSKFSLEDLQRMAKDEGFTSHMAAGQLQQRPTAREGGLFKREWFENPVHYVAEDRLEFVRAWDIASVAEESSDPDYTVGVKMAKDRLTNVFYILDVIRGRWTPAEVERKIYSTAVIDGTECRVRIPQDPGAAGKFTAHHLVVLLQGYSVAIEREIGKKENRADPLAAQCENGMVKLLKADWNEKFVDEFCAFSPQCAHDDQVDAAAAAFRALLRRVSWSAVAA